jgi:hypothetical protein
MHPPDVVSYPATRRVLICVVTSSSVIVAPELADSALTEDESVRDCSDDRVIGSLTHESHNTLRALLHLAVTLQEIASEMAARSV